MRDLTEARDILVRERPAVVPYLQPVAVQVEGQRCCVGILRVLDQLEDEMGAFAIQVPQ